MKPICKMSPLGDKWWYLNDKLHREDGPAIKSVYGYNEWILNGLRHREGGPAVEYPNGYKAWYYHGEKIDCKDNEEFLIMIK
jgi:hypothetical protein